MKLHLATVGTAQYAVTAPDHCTVRELVAKVRPEFEEPMQIETVESASVDPPASILWQAGTKGHREEEGRGQ